MLKVKNLTKKFGSKVAVNNISFEVSRGEVMGFIGPNGAGKSTAMRMITGFIPPSSGSIKVGEHDVETNPMATKSLIGYLPENAPLYSNKSVSEFLGFAAELRGYYGKDNQNKIENAINQCFLEPVRNQTIDTLSKGYRQRTCFAQAIIHDPEILILDEPTDGLDPNQKNEVRNLIKEMGKNKAIIISTHILEEVEAVTSRVLLISHGDKLFDGTPEAFKSHSKDAKTFTLKILNQSAEKVLKEIRTIDIVADIETLKTNASGAALKFCCLKNSDPEELQKSVAECISKKKWEVLEFKANQGNLNEVFANLTKKIIRN